MLTWTPTPALTRTLSRTWTGSQTWIGHWQRYGQSHEHSHGQGHGQGSDTDRNRNRNMKMNRSRNRDRKKDRDKDWRGHEISMSSEIQPKFRIILLLRSSQNFGEKIYSKKFYNNTQTFTNILMKTPKVSILRTLLKNSSVKN
jgi:hypothetical protein